MKVDWSKLELLGRALLITGVTVIVVGLLVKIIVNQQVLIQQSAAFYSFMMN